MNTAPEKQTESDYVLMSKDCVGNRRYYVQLVKTPSAYVVRVRDLECTDDDNTVRFITPHNEPQGIAWLLQLSRSKNPTTEKVW